MKKLKLNKETVSILGNNGQKNIKGGVDDITTYISCVNYSQDYDCKYTNTEKKYSCDRIACPQ